MVGSWGPAAAGGKPRTQTDLRNTAVELRGKNLPVILYRVASKGVLKSEEKKAQTLSSSVHASVGGTRGLAAAKDRGLDPGRHAGPGEFCAAQ